MSDSYKLGQQLAHHEYLREQLAEKFPDADEETLRDTLEGMTDLNDMLATLIRSSLDDEMFAQALKNRITTMEDRYRRFEVRRKKKRDLVCMTMDRASLKKITESDFTLSLRAGKPNLLVTDESAIPTEYWMQQAPKLARKDLGYALTAGKSIPGATLTNAPPTISVRTK